MRTRWRWLVLFGLAVIPLTVWGYDRAFTVHWVGHTDLEIEFVVTDATTGHPVEGAEVAVRPDGGLYQERDEAAFALRTDAAGTARRVCHSSMCFGTQSGLGFTDTYVVHLPWWDVRVSAAGCEPVGNFFLDVPEYVRQVERVGPRAAKLVVQVSLRKSAAEPLGAPDRGGGK